MSTTNFYTPPAEWTGRTDGTEEEALRWHQHVIPVNVLAGEKFPVLQPGQQGIVFLGFASDEGVRRNKGREGAAAGPAILRGACANFPVHFDSKQLILADAGNVVCFENALEPAHELLCGIVLSIKKAGYLPVLLGGGHEITYGHAQALYAHLYMNTPTAKLGLINFDAHFDLRIPGEEGSTSGTGFYQLSEYCKELERSFHYLALGIQTNSNTQQLFRIAGELDVQYIDADAFHLQDRSLLQAAISEFVKEVDQIYLTIDLDVFGAAFAPGVSASAYNGIRPDGLFLECFRTILQSGKIAGLDIAELNPAFDVDNRTARLGAALVFEAVSNIS